MIYLKRYILSLWGLILVKYYCLRTRSATSLQLRKSYRRVFIICPGPSASRIVDEEFTDDDMIIFINHAIKLVDDINKNSSTCISDNLFYFSLDTPRTNEVYNLHLEEISKVKAFFLPYHFMHIPHFDYLRKINFVLNPKFTFSWEYGFELNNKGTNGFNKISSSGNSACGFGTLVSALQLAFTIGERNIVLFGCDFGESQNKRYFINSIPNRQDTPFDVIKYDFFEVCKKLKKLHWKIEIK